MFFNFFQLLILNQLAKNQSHVFFPEYFSEHRYWGLCECFFPGLLELQTLQRLPMSKTFWKILETPKKEFVVSMILQKGMQFILNLPARSKESDSYSL